MKASISSSMPVPEIPRAKSAEVAKDLEAYFLRHAFREAGVGRSALTPKSFTADTFAELLQGALADQIAAQGGLGLTRAIQEQLRVSAGDALGGPLLPVIPVAGKFTSEFGHRLDPITHGMRAHHGIDIAAPRGTSVRSADAGIVTFVGERGDYGNLIVVRHRGDLETRYAHLGEALVKPGDQVAAGHTIGRVGNTGRTTGPHLHFEVRRGEAPVDPTKAVVGLNESRLRSNQ